MKQTSSTIAPPTPRQLSLASAQALARRQAKLKQHQSRWGARLKTHQTARLVVAGIFILGLVTAAAQPTWRIELPLVLIFLAVFPWLVVRTRNIALHLNSFAKLAQFYQRQESRCRGETAPRAWEGAEKSAESLPLTRDLGLLGSHSLFTLVDETLTDRGEKKLLEWMSHRPRSADEILRRQKQVQSLRHLSWFYTRLALASDAVGFRLSSDQVLDFLKTPFVPGSFTKIYILNLAVWLVFIANVITSSLWKVGSPGPFLILFTALSLWSLSRVGSTFKKGLGLAHHMGELAPIFRRIEKQTTHDSTLRELMPATHAGGPSKETKHLNRILSFLGVEANPLLHIVINALLPWSMSASFFLERRRRKVSEIFPQCMSELAEFEALGSLLILDRYQTRTYPRFEKEPTLRFQEMFHPLLAREKVVANDFAFDKQKSLGLLTGSNMSGKSTFLRTIGVNQTLANMGAPVFAESFITTPYQIETCIEVSDSLRDGFSYFYAEVRRLKALLKEAEQDRPVLFLIDEIFRGTNNRERQIGSQAIIRHLAHTREARGFISTHDLELTALEEQEPSVLNLHFRENIENGIMVFSYKLHPGPCPTTNALKIMEAEGIDLSLVKSEI